MSLDGPKASLYHLTTYNISLGTMAASRHKRAEPTFTVHSNCSVCRLTYLEKPSDYRVTRCGTVNEEQVVVIKATICEPLGIIDLLV